MDGLAVRVVVAQLCSRVPGGTARYAASLVAALAAATPAGAQLRGVTSRACPATDALDVPVTSLGIPAPALARLWERGMPPWVAHEGVVHAPTLLVPPARAAVPLVVTVHDVVPWTHPQTLTPRGVAFHHRMGARAARDAAAIITPTHAVAAAVREVLAPACPVFAVHSGVSVQAAPPDAAARREHRGIRDPYVLFVGTAEPRKGLDRLVAAMARPALAGLSLVVVGPPGWGRVEVAELARAAGIADRVHVTGRVDEADLAGLYAGARVLAMPSEAEGFGFPVVEAMAHGVPVVTSADPALVEVGGGVARVVDPADIEALAQALAEAAAPGTERSEAVRAGRERAASFTWEATARHTWRIYADVARA